MKPLIRWTIGDASTSISFKVLELSIRLFKKHFKEFDCIICTNATELVKINIVKDIAKKLNVEIFEQTSQHIPENLSKISSFWKFCPLRLRSESHEIIIDNDILIFEKLEKINMFLASNKTLICEDNFRFFGKFDHLHKDGIALNSGLVGFPPFYNIEKEINFFLKEKESLNYADEQGLVMAILNKEDNIKISTKEISILHFDKFYDGEKWIDYSNFDFFRSKGFHFVGINRRASHLGWDIYKKLHSISLI